jgi:hypothetical protein
VPRLQLLAPLVLALAFPAFASAAFFPAETIDGPSGDIVRVGGVDTARDGGSVVVYVKKVTGIDHVFAARMVDGVWQPPERLDSGLPLPSGEPVVGVANRGQSVVAFTNNGQLYAIVRRRKDARWPAPVAVGPPVAATPSIDLSVNGVGYLVWSSGGDVRAATLARTQTVFAVLDPPVDITPANDAGTGLGRPVVAASADGTGLVAWGEAGHAYARRLLHATLSQVPQELGVPVFNGHPGGEADTPEVDISDDSSFAWVSFRQAFDSGATTRVLARRLVGSAYDPPVDVGAGSFGGEGAGAPALDVAGTEKTAIFGSESTVTHAPAAALEYLTTFVPPFSLSNGNPVAALPTVAIGETSQAATAWFDGSPVTVHARSFKFGEAVEPELALSAPALGPADGNAGLYAAADKYGDTVIPFVQGVPGARRLVAAIWDRPPVNLIATTTFKWRTSLPLGWDPVSEVWGGITYTVVVDGKPFDTTTKHSLPIAGLLADGAHYWRVVATDRRGQRATTPTRTLRLDNAGPRLAISVRGRHAPRKVLNIVIHATDAGAGVRSVKLDFGDGSTPVFGTSLHHAFARGTYTLRATGVDKLGNVRAVTRRLAVG